MAQDTVLIVDAPNYIKGFRYQMYCAAREMKLRVCTVRARCSHLSPSHCHHVGLRRCNSRSVPRVECISYRRESICAGNVRRIVLFPFWRLTHRRLENLLVRFEEPSSMVRWDSPLFTILWTEENIPAAEIAQAIMSGNVKPPNSGTLAVRTLLA